MARDRRRHANGTEGLGSASSIAVMSLPAPACPMPDKGRSSANHAGIHPLPEDRALFLHMIRALAREAARSDHADESTAQTTRD